MFNRAWVDPPGRGHFLDRKVALKFLPDFLLGLQPFDVVCYTEEEYEKGTKAFLPGIIEEEGVAGFKFTGNGKQDIHAVEEQFDNAFLLLQRKAVSHVLIKRDTAGWVGCCSQQYFNATDSLRL